MNTQREANGTPIVPPKILGADGQEAQKALPEECCGSCLYGFISSDVVNQGAIATARECRRGPPTVQHFMMQAKPNSRPSIMTHSNWGPTPIDGWCGAGVKRDDGTAFIGPLREVIRQQQRAQALAKASADGG